MDPHILLHGGPTLDGGSVKRKGINKGEVSHLLALTLSGAGPSFLALPSPRV